MAPRTPLLQPASYFESYHASVIRAGLIVLLVSFAVVASFLAMGNIFASRMDGTVEMDNPEHPSDWVCEEHGDDPDSVWYDGCNQPKTIEKSMGDILRKEFSERVGLLFVGTFLAWGFLAVVLHVLAKLADGSGSFLETLAVTGWGMAPTVLGAILGVVIIYFSVKSVEFGSDPEVIASQIRQLRNGGIGPASTVVSVAIAGWQGYIWAYGLRSAHDISIGAAGTIAGLVALGSVLL